MNKRLSEEVSRQKELMNINEQGVLGDVKTGLISQMAADFVKNVLDLDDEEDSDDSGSDYTSSRKIKIII